jgi:hypothetical protein
MTALLKAAVCSMELMKIGEVRKSLVCPDGTR